VTKPSDADLEKILADTARADGWSDSAVTKLLESARGRLAIKAMRRLLEGTPNV